MPMEPTELDQLIMSYIVYYDLTDYQKELAREGLLTIGQLVKNNEKVLKELEDSKPKFKSESDFESFKNIIDSLSDPKSKYYYWKIKDVDDQNSTTGFVAYTFEPMAGQALVTFRGSEAMQELRHLNTDWRNNASTIYEELSVQQRNAIDYLNRVGQNYDYLNVSGHSLGGNIALAATVGATDAIRKKIQNTYTYNAPGFNQTFIREHQEAIYEMKSKIKEFQNENDFVSSILTNLSAPIIIPALAHMDQGFQSMIDNHFLNYLALENGTLVRKDPQKKTFACDFIHNFINDLALLPAPMLEGLVNMTFEIMNNRVDFKNIINAALVLLIIDPVDTILLAGGAALATGIIALVVVAIVGVQTLIPMIAEEVGKFVAWVNDAVIHVVKVAFEGIARTTTAILTAIGDFYKTVMNAISNVFNGMVEAVKGWWNAWFNPDYDLEINVDLYRLREIAAKLQNIQYRLGNIDEKIHSLYSFQDIWRSINVLLIDWNVGYENDLARCISYLNQTADRFEMGERKLLEAAYNFK